VLNGEHPAGDTIAGPFVESALEPDRETAV
jgi:hypothetical protein